MPGDDDNWPHARSDTPKISWRRRAVALALSAASLTPLGALVRARPRHEPGAAALFHSTRGALPSGVTNVCPLNDADAQRAIDAFTKLTPLFNQEPRCVNCHGAMNIADTKARTTHPGDTFGAAALDSADRGGKESPCYDCHSEAKEWRIPPDPMLFAGKDSRTLCNQMKRMVGDHGLGHHLKADETGLVDVGFSGTRALSEAGQGLVSGKKYAPEPPKNFTQPQAVDLATTWDSAAILPSTVDIEDCGCIPLHYALRVDYKGVTIPYGFFAFVTWRSVSSVDIPIKFLDTQGHLTGDAPDPMVDSGGAPACPTVAHFTADLTLSNASVRDGQFHADISSPPVKVSHKVNCAVRGGSDRGPGPGMGPFSNSTTNEERAPLASVSLPAQVGADTSVAVQGPVGNGTVHVTLIQVGAGR